KRWRRRSRRRRRSIHASATSRDCSGSKIPAEKESPINRSRSMTRPFEGIRIIDVTHVLAGPFAAYQLAVLGAEVIKVEHPDDPDQTRDSGTDRELNRRGMGTSYLTQSSNKRSITLDLKTEAGRDILKRLVQRADIM